MSTRSQRSQQTPPVPRKNQDQQSKKTKQQPDTNHHIDSRRPVTWHQKQSRTVEFSNNPPTTRSDPLFRGAFRIKATSEVYLIDSGLSTGSFGPVHSPLSMPAHASQGLMS
jgi:hypothetical protein